MDHLIGQTRFSIQVFRVYADGLEQVAEFATSEMKHLSVRVGYCPPCWGVQEFNSELGSQRSWSGGHQRDA